MYTIGMLSKVNVLWGGGGGGGGVVVNDSKGGRSKLR